MSAPAHDDGSDPEAEARAFHQIDPDLLVLLGQFPTNKQAGELSLVLRAKGIPHQIRQSSAGFSLIVAADRFDEAQQELEQYEEENVDWPPREEPPRPGPFWARATIFYLALIALLFAFDRGEAFGISWRVDGRVDGARMTAGEWLRAVTGLTLHADLVHLLSNMTYGALFGGLVAYSLGGGVGWLAILSSGALGNLLNVWIHGFDHRSIGASTAVFGAVGVLTGSEVMRRHLLKQRRLRRAAPVLVGFLLLSYLGMGGAENRDQTTDVTAHLAGMVAGIVVGAPLGRMRQSVTGDARIQLLAGGVAVALVLGAWFLALAS